MSPYRYTKSGERVDNVTDWAVRQFRARYGSISPLVGEVGAAASGGGPAASAAEENLHAAGGESSAPQTRRAPTPTPPHKGEGLSITKDLIFAYCYAVLHDPVYRATHADDLRREFPRIPLYDDFALWAGWGERLLTLHIGYEKAKAFPFVRVDARKSSPERGGGSPGRGRVVEGAPSVSPDGLPPPRSGEDFRTPKPKLRSFPEQGLVIVDEDTQLTGIPHDAWDYRLGNRSAIDWVLDQHKEKMPRDPTVAAKFNTYRFADHKESMIALLGRVVTVSLETIAITEAMRALPAGARGTASQAG